MGRLKLARMSGRSLSRERRKGWNGGVRSVVHQNSKQPRYNFRNYECTFVLEKLQNQLSVKHSRRERTRAHFSTTVIAISN